MVKWLADHAIHIMSRAVIQKDPTRQEAGITDFLGGDCPRR